MPATLIRAQTLVDGAGAPAIQGGAAVLLADGVIQAVGPRDAVTAPSDAEIVELPDSSIVPGIVDGHVHLMLGVPSDPFLALAQADDARLFAWGAANAQACLAAGLTTIYDCGGPGTHTLVLRDAIQNGLLAGPRILAAGAPVTTTGGHCNWLGNRADSKAEVIKATRQLVQDGADFIKVMATGGSLTPASNRHTPQYSRKEMKALVSEAHRLKRRIVAHCNATVGIERSVRAGVDIISHCNWLGPVPGDLAYDDDIARRMGEQGMFVDFNIEGAIGQLAGRDGSVPEWPHDGPVPETRWEIGRRMRQLGVRVYLTSDAIGRNYGLLPRNLATMPARFGESPVDLLSRVTSVPAAAQGLEGQIGALKPGLSADVLVVSGNVEHDLHGLARPELVYLRGQLVAERGRVSLPARLDARA